MWRGKVLTQVVESTLIVWENLGLSPMHVIYVLIVLLLIFNNMYGYGIGIVILSLTWIGWIGYTLEWWLNGHGFKLGW